MTEAYQRLGSTNRHRLQVDLRLVPQFEPIVLQRDFKIAATCRNAGGFSHVSQPCPQLLKPEWFAEDRQHGKPTTLADLADLVERGRVVTADEQDFPGKPRCCQAAHHLDGIGSPERQVENNDLRLEQRQRRFHLRHSTEFVRDKPRTDQGLRDESANLRLVVNDERVTPARRSR